MVNGGALSDFLLQQLVILSGQCFIAGLGNAPGLVHITIQGSTAQIVAHAGIIISGQYSIGLFQTIYGVKGNILVVFRIHNLVEGSALEQSIASLHPFIPARFSKFIQGNLREFGHVF